MAKFLKLLAMCLVSWFSWVSIAIAAPSNPEIIHLLNRLTFGPTAADIEQVQQLGIEQYIQQQLQPSSIQEPVALGNQLAELGSLQLSQTQLSQSFDLPPKLRKVGQGPVNQAFIRQVRRESKEARLVRAIASSRQLQEVMVDFWFNHFNVSDKKGRTSVWVGSYEQEAIRPFVLGNFRDLLGATARHPAMLFYLDNWLNTAPNSPGARNRLKGLNENYARELMELHTLGVDGGYTQADVESLAKILTGWSLQLKADPKKRDESFQFVARRHDFSDKVFLGHAIPGSGQAEVEQALDILASHPATAHYVSYQLAQYFVADTPPEQLVEDLAQAFASSGGNIREMLEVLFHSKDFWQPQYRNAKFKTPYQYVVSTIRLADSMPKQIGFPQSILRHMGMPIYGCVTPDGYGNTRSDWLNPDGLERRLDFAIVFARRQKLQANADELLMLLGDRISPETQAAIEASPPGMRSALVLGSPELMWR